MPRLPVSQGTAAVGLGPAEEPLQTVPAGAPAPGHPLGARACILMWTENERGLRPHAPPPERREVQPPHQHCVAPA